MYLDQISSARPETPLIARDGLVRQQWEAVVADLDAASGQRAWQSRRFSTWPQWLAGRFEAAESGQTRPSLVLSPRQTDKLWQRVIDSSNSGAGLIESSGLARWARLARRSLLEHGQAPSDQHGPLWRDDAAVFLEWNREFEAELRAMGWVDPDSLLYRINRMPAERVAEDIVLLDSPSSVPEIERLTQTWQAAGCRVAEVEPDGDAAAIDALIAANPADEIRLAARWAADRLRERPDARLAIVIPDLQSRREEVESIFVDQLGPAAVTSAGSRALGDFAIFGAALTALRLLGPQAGFETLSRWLRNPFFSSQDQARARCAAELEISLRRDPAAQAGFARAWAGLGLKGRFQGLLPDTARRIEQALDRLPARATPTSWTAVWQSCLRILGWQGFETALPVRLQSAWDNAWAGFAELTPILGLIPHSAALDVFGEIVAANSIYEPMGLRGIVLLTQIAEVGPGFSGAWVAGFTDDLAAPTDGANPLLPWAVQAKLGIPGAQPEQALAASLEELARLERRVPEARFSCPARVGDEPRKPSPLVTGWDAGTARAAAGLRRTGYAAERAGARGWEELPDPAPALTRDRIRGGTRTLDLQSGCPVKAFCIARLRAEPIDAPARGIDPRLRGILIHRVLEQLLDPDANGLPGDRIGTAIEQAFGSLTHRGDAGWEVQLRAERGRVEDIVERLLEAEAARPPFMTSAVERRAKIEVNGRWLKCRLDRVDRLASGETLLIDYKTGQSVPDGWFDARLSDCQLPAYALEAEPACIAAIRLGAGNIEYRWAGRVAEALPGRGRTFDEAGWQAQLERWREQVGQLVDEFVCGDVRVPSDAAEHVASDRRDRAGGAFAPLTRVGDIR
jgi:ATP-dependent helicase/nuclease subunit B